MSVVNEIMVRMSKNDIELVLTQTDTAFLIDAKTAIYEGRWENAVESLEVFDAIAACPKPTLAVIDGPAVAGGLELALACDLRIASPRARFALPEPSLGLIPAAGATFRLPLVAGEATARQMILFGAELDAQQALAHGLVAEVVAPEELDDRVRWWAGKVGERDPLFPPGVVRAAAGLLPGARVVEIPGSGHSPYFEEPEAWNAAVAAFLATAGA